MDFNNRFSPRLADVGGTRFWRFDAQADYGLLNPISAHHLSLQKIEPHWDDMLRLAGSLKLGRGHLEIVNIDLLRKEIQH